VHDAQRLAELEVLVRSVFQEVDQYLQSAENAVRRDSAGREKLKAAASVWDAAAEANSRNYDEAKGRAAENEAALKQIAELERRQAELTEAIAGRDARVAELDNPEGQYETLQDEWRAAHASRGDVLRAQCQKLGQLSTGLLRATLHPGADPERFSSLLKELVRGTKMRTDKFDQLLQNVMNESDPLAAWLEVVGELRVLSEMADAASGTLPSCPRLGSAQVSEADRRKMAEKLGVRGWSEFATLELEDLVRFEYKGPNTSRSGMPQRASKLPH
jgi:hypothetical protein